MSNRRKIKNQKSNARKLRKQIQELHSLLNEAESLLMTQEAVDFYEVDPEEFTNLMEAAKNIKTGTSIEKLKVIKEGLSSYSNLNMLNSVTNRFTITDYMNTVKETQNLSHYEKGHFNQMGGFSGTLGSDEMYALIKEYNRLVEEGFLPKSNYLLSEYNAAAGLMERMLTKEEIEELTDKANEERLEIHRKRQEQLYADIVMI